MQSLRVLYRVRDTARRGGEAVEHALAAWARRQNFNIMFEVHRFRNLDVLYVLLEGAR
jgi:hypothetical protein